MFIATSVKGEIQNHDAPPYDTRGVRLVTLRCEEMFLDTRSVVPYRHDRAVDNYVSLLGHDALSILHPAANGALEITGQLDNIAPSVDIRSVRYNGDVGFMVTFKKTDPLFVFDLSDPTAPTILGELKIPGYSTYMHFLDETHLLTIGYDADEMGDFAYFDGIQLQILDVSDLTDPHLVHREIIGSRGSTSEAATNHLAFNYFPSRDLLALPMVVCEGGDEGVYGDRMSFNGLMVYQVTADGGFL